MRFERTLTMIAAGAVALAATTSASAGPETSLRELASAQIKKGVRSVGMGGDGATWGNYALVYNDAGTAIAHYGIVRYLDTGRVWARVGLDETTWTGGMSVKVAPFKLDLAYLRNLGAERTGDVFGKTNVGFFGTLTYEYAHPE